MKKPLSFYKKKLDKIFSLYIRYRDAGVCYTCDKDCGPKSAQCGHFVPRQYLAVRWDETNCHAQCYACNMLYNGQPSAYAIRLTEEFGPNKVKELESKRREITKLTPQWYEEKIAYYNDQLKQMGVL
jgi:hypothetical protein